MPNAPLACLPLVLLIAACGSSEPTACDGFADRKLAVTGVEYHDCAGEILAALDATEAQLRVIVSGTADDQARDAARREYERLRTRIRRTGIEDDYRSMRPGTVIVKWPDGPVSAFNSAAFKATFQYGAVLAYPNADNFEQGVRAHEQARGHYHDIQ